MSTATSPFSDYPTVPSLGEPLSREAAATEVVNLQYEDPQNGIEMVYEGLLLNDQLFLNMFMNIHPRHPIPQHTHTGTARQSLSDDPENDQVVPEFNMQVTDPNTVDAQDTTQQIFDRAFPSTNRSDF